MTIEQNKQAAAPDAGIPPSRSWGAEFERLWEAVRAGDDDALDLLEQCSYFAGALLDSRLPETAPAVGRANLIREVLAMQHPELFLHGLGWLADSDIKAVVDHARAMAASAAGKKSGDTRKEKVSRADSWQSVARRMVEELHTMHPDWSSKRITSSISGRLPVRLAHDTIRKEVDRIRAELNSRRPDCSK